MKLLFDQNLSFKLVEGLSDIFPNSSHVKFHDLIKADDYVVRMFALEHEFSIVTQDSDFYDLALIHGSPPKIIWIRTGNSSSSNIQKLIRDNVMAILHLHSEMEKHCIELF